MSRSYDVILWGASGFTGKLVAENFATKFPSLRWAVAGRNLAALESLKEQLKLPDSVGLITVSDVNDASAVDALTCRTKVLLSTAGPFAKIGTPIVQSCIRMCTNYADITGETQWVKSVVENFHDEAKRKKLKIVNCCGFDCSPSDLGTLMMVDEVKRLGLEVKEVRLIADMDGAASGGTIASILNMFATSSIAELQRLSNPYCLNGAEPVQHPPAASASGSTIYSQSSDNMIPGYDSVFKVWTAPYVMQGIDTRVVNRSNFLTGFGYGKDFAYAERMATSSLIASLFISLSMPLFGMLMFFPFTRNLLSKIVPQPGSGPSVGKQNRGWMRFKMWARTSDPSVVVKGTVTMLDADPGYKGTARMASEAAVCLALDSGLPEHYGVLTPSTAMGAALRARLQARGMEFKIV